KGLKRIRPIGAVVRGIEDVVAVGVAGARAASEREEAAKRRDVENIHVAVGRVGGDVLADGSGRDGSAEVTGHLRDVEDVRKGIVVQVGGPGVVAAAE